MTETRDEAPSGIDALKDRLLDAVLVQVPFDGWSDAALRMAAQDVGVDVETARALFPRGGVDLALAFHDRADRQLAEELAAGSLSHLRYSERIAHAVRRRLELVAPHKEAVRRAAALFALPIHAVDGARAIWHTADVIWNGLGDRAEDYNWYTKRASLAGVISATILYWLGDNSENSERTWAFLDRRIGEVMRVEEMKARLRRNPISRLAFAGPRAILSCIRPPHEGYWSGPWPRRWRRRREERGPGGPDGSPNAPGADPVGTG